MTLGDYHTCQSYKTVNKWRGWYVSRCHVSWRCCWSTFNSAAEENKWEGRGWHLSNYKQISTALVMLGRLNRVCTGPGHLICKIRLMYVCEALHVYWATCFEIMTLGDLGSENTNWLPAAQQANRHVTAMALGCWFQMLFLSAARVEDQVQLHSQGWSRQAGMAEARPSDAATGLLCAVLSMWSYAHCSLSADLRSLAFDYLHLTCEPFVWDPAQLYGLPSCHPTQWSNFPWGNIKQK